MNIDRRIAGNMKTNLKPPSITTDQHRLQHILLDVITQLFETAPRDATMEVQVSIVEPRHGEYLKVKFRLLSQPQPEQRIIRQTNQRGIFNEIDLRQVEPKLQLSKLLAGQLEASIGVHSDDDE